MGAFLSLSLVCAGGMSNLVDRLLHNGLVTDFLILRLGLLRTGVFNLADVMIVLGTLLFVLNWRPQRNRPSGSFLNTKPKP